MADQKTVDVWYDRVEEHLKTFNWKKFHNTRKSVAPEGMSHKQLLTAHLGVVRRKCVGYCMSKAALKNPDFFFCLQQLAKALNFECEVFTVNKNLICRPHYDAQIRGQSLTISFGTFTNGRTVVEGQAIDTKRHPLKFDSREMEHWTEPWLPADADRYCVVMYNLRYPEQRSEPLVEQ